MKRHFLIALALCAVGCSDEVIVLAHVAGQDAGPGAPAVRCTSSSECGGGMFCERTRCDEVAGTCTPFPISCSGDEQPVCGCDGVSYFNDCLRRIAGVAASTPEECKANGLGCSPTKACPADAVCSQLAGGKAASGDPCRPGPQEGRCWVLPPTCPPASRADRWDECVPPAGTEPPTGAPPPLGLQCVDTCTAIRAGRRFSRARECR